MKKATTILLLALYSVSLYSQVILEQSNKAGIYSKGEKIVITATAEKISGDSVHIRILKNNNYPIASKALIQTGLTFTVFEGTFEEPCSIIAEVTSKEGSVSTGLVVAPELLKPGMACPADFKKFWKEEKKKLSTLKYEIKTTPVPGTEAGYSCVDIEINCLGPKPARGYFAKPESAAKKSLPAVLFVHAAGVKGSWCRSEPGNAMKYAKMGAICLDLNAHGMLNGQSDKYYADLEEGELKNYFLQGIESRDEYYFKGMYLRLLRAIDFLARQPEWDGKRILVTGESQGGGQSLAAAGLDSRVSAVVALVPAMCDWFGPVVQRKGGWPQPYESKASKEKMQKSLPYFDAANLLKGSRATIFVEIGLIDQTCPATSVYSAVNQSKGKKIIYAVPYRPHQQSQMPRGNDWQETVYKPREAFIRDYLKNY
jgi:cephalosporin-C deacetylase-like acetyl esterase